MLVTKSCPTLWDPWTTAHQAPLSMKYSRQAYWNGLPFPSPGYLSEQGIKATSPALQADTLSSEPQGKPPKYTILCLVSQSCPTLWPQGLQSTRPLCPWGFSRQDYWSGLPCPPPGDLCNWGIEPRSPALQADSLLSESPRKSKNTGVGSLSLL